MPRNAKSVSEAQTIVAPLVNKILTNKTFGTTAKIYPKSITKMGSDRATLKSISSELHAKAVANADVLYQNAILKTSHPDAKNRREIEQIHRFGSVMYDEKSKSYIPVMITVFEYKAEARGHDGNRLVDNFYSIEAVDILKEEVRRASTADLNEEGHVPITDFYEKLFELINNTTTNNIHDFGEKVNK